MKTLIALVLVITLSQISVAQVAVNSDNSAPDASAMLDVKSTDKGVLIPRMNKTQRTSISGPAEGLLVFDTDSESFWFFSSGTWTELINRNNTVWTKNGSDIHYDSGDVGVGTDSPERRLHVAVNNSSTITSQFLVEQNGTGDAFMNVGLNGSHHYNLGVDNSDAGKFKIGYDATQASGVTSSTFFTLTTGGRLGLGNTNPSDRLQVDASTGEPALRVRQNGDTKLRVHSNGGTSIGANSTPPVNGLKVIGDIEPQGDITTDQNLLIESTGVATNIELRKGLSSLLLDDTGIYGNVQDNTILQTTIENNKLEMNGNGLAAKSDNNIVIQSDQGDITVETLKTNGTITIKAGNKEIIVDENGGITINSGGNDLTINTGGGNFTVDAGNGDISLTGRDLTFTASNLLNAFSDEKMKLESKFDQLELKSDFDMSLNSNASILQTSASNITITSGIELKLDAGLNMDLDAATTFDINSGNNMSLGAPLITLNGPGTPAARVNDTTVGSSTSQVIVTGSPTVLIGG